MNTEDPRIHVIAKILLRACEKEGGRPPLLRPWKPFDVHQVAIEILRAVENAPGLGV